VEHAALRPIERRVLRLAGEGMDHAEIARRFRRSPEFIERVMGFARLPGRSSSSVGDDAVLRPLERRILGWRARGAAPAEIAPRFHRSPGFVERVELLANYKLSLQ
jgi:DNA-binding CsgD family transcriptional regulator